MRFPHKKGYFAATAARGSIFQTCQGRDLLQPILDSARE